MRRLKTGADKYIQKGQFVFTRCGPQPGGGQGGRGSEGIDTLFNLPLINYYLAHLCQAQPHWLEKSAAAIASEFVPHGVVLNAIGNDAGSGGERLVVCTVRGFADTFNVWGNRVYDGDSLYFVYKEVVRSSFAPPAYSYDFSGTPAKPALQAREDGSDQKYWQIFPAVCPGDARPNLADLTDGDQNHACTTPDDAKHKQGEYQGIARYVGRVQHARNSTGSCVLGTPEHAGLTRELILMTNVCQFTVFS